MIPGLVQMPFTMPMWPNCYTKYHQTHESPLPEKDNVWALIRSAQHLIKPTTALHQTACEKCSLQEMACPKNSEWLVLRAGLSFHHSRACPNSEWLVLTAGLSSHHSRASHPSLRKTTRELSLNLHIIPKQLESICRNRTQNDL